MPAFNERMQRSAGSLAMARCSFCGRREVPVGASWRDVTICTQCVELSLAILAEADRRTGPAT